MCGIFGIYLKNEKSNAYNYILNGLSVLQHRGQDSAGICTFKNNKFFFHKDNGKVSDVFNNSDIANLLEGNIGLGHVRYSTLSSLNADLCQPFYTNMPYGLALCHNGNIVNTDELRCIINNENIHNNTDSDSQLLLHLFALKLFKIVKSEINHNSFFEIISQLYKIVKGSYSIVMLINGYGLLAFKDPHGIRPLCFGKSEDNNYIIASESVAIKYNDFYLEREINAGECVFIDNNGEFFSRQIIENPDLRPCLFEYIYFSRPDSIINGILVYQTRKKMGEILGFKIQNDFKDILNEIDVVMPVPDTARIAALKMSYILNKPYCEGFVKNNYVGRTFIMPTQKERKQNIKMKLNTIEQKFLNKNVLIVDDSIVRGNTSIQIIQLARKAGAKKIYFASIAPPIYYPNYYGIAIPTSQELVAYNRTNTEITTKIGADLVIYNDLQDVLDICSKISNRFVKNFETSCFDGNYILL
jgi:amidophosphoribosyltransferase